MRRRRRASPDRCGRSPRRPKSPRNVSSRSYSSSRRYSTAVPRRRKTGISIAAALARIQPERTWRARLLQQVKQLDQRLLSFDEKTLPALTARAGPMTPRQRSALYRAVLEERDKIGIERKIEYIESYVEKYDAQAVA